MSSSYNPSSLSCVSSSSTFPPAAIAPSCLAIKALQPHRQVPATPSPATSVQLERRSADLVRRSRSPIQPRAFPPLPPPRSRRQCPAQICARCVPLRPLNGAGPTLGGTGPPP
ncbi:hypothetical protein K523DRAFT_124924 [Schizophyllum commune Tattone D]|nr:hypothetical protein K523DRAFT_124924 [Schizophyllum commune Tattone D]